jgi:hypothetical protein
MKASGAAARASRDMGLYDVDFFQWTRSAALLLRQRRFKDLDIDHVAEEIEDMGKREYKELGSRLQVLIAHLLKWQLQPRKRSNSWRATIMTQRIEIRRTLRESPSLRHHLSTDLEENYRDGFKRAAAETGLEVGAFPEKCPFSLDQILDEEFLPGE